jgi:hypothetical protein
MPMLDLGPRRPKKERVPNSDERQGPTYELVSIFSGYWRWALPANMKRSMTTVYIGSAVIQTVKLFFAI